MSIIFDSNYTFYLSQCSTTIMPTDSKEGSLHVSIKPLHRDRTKILIATR